MPKLFVCLLSCLIFVAGFAQTGPGQYHVGVDTIVKGISQGKLVVDSTEVVKADFLLTAFYGASHQPAFEYESGPRIKDGYILAEFWNVTKKSILSLTATNAQPFYPYAPFWPIIMYLFQTIPSFSLIS